MNRITVLFLLLSSAILALGCKSKGPAPGDPLTEQEDVIMAEREGAPPSGAQALGIPTKDYERDYKKAPHDPHGPAGHLNPPSSHKSGQVDRIDVGGLSFKAPEGWEYQHPTSAMRRAELGVRDEEGTAGLVVYYFGSKGAGSPKDNIERWVGQFRNPDGSALQGVEPVTEKIAGLEVTRVEVAGSYASGMGDDAAQQRLPGQRMIAAIVNTPTGPYYLKFFGDDEVVTKNRAAFEGLLRSIQPSGS